MLAQITAKNVRDPLLRHSGRALVFSASQHQSQYTRVHNTLATAMTYNVKKMITTLC